MFPAGQVQPWAPGGPLGLKVQNFNATMSPVT
jgi:hypothetical protein